MRKWLGLSCLILPPEFASFGGMREGNISVSCRFPHLSAGDAAYWRSIGYHRMAAEADTRERLIDTLLGRKR